MAFTSIVHQAIEKNSICYKENRPMPGGKPGGIVVHSTGANNPNAKRYVNAPDICGENIYKNWFGGPAANTTAVPMPHGVIGKDKNGDVKVFQILPYDRCCWGCASGKNGSYNFNPAYIQFEICEDALKDQKYFEAAFDAAARYCAELMIQFPSITLSNVVSHKEAHARGYASGHGDPENWLSKFGKDMNWVRKQVQAWYDKLKAEDAQSSTTTTAEPGKFYRVQLGAFSKKENAEAYLKEVQKTFPDAFIKLS